MRSAAKLAHGTVEVQSELLQASVLSAAVPVALLNRVQGFVAGYHQVKTGQSSTVSSPLQQLQQTLCTGVGQQKFSSCLEPLTAQQQQHAACKRAAVQAVYVSSAQTLAHAAIISMRILQAKAHLLCTLTQQPLTCGLYSSSCGAQASAPVMNTGAVLRTAAASLVTA